MIKDFYGEAESESNSPEEEEIISEEIPASAPEEVQSKIETLEDELLNIFEGLDKEDKPLEEKEQAETAQVSRQRTFCQLFRSSIRPYLVMGTMERAVWRQSLKDPIPIGELLDHVHIFRQVLRFEPEHYGWVRE